MNSKLFALVAMIAGAVAIPLIENTNQGQLSCKNATDLLVGHTNAMIDGITDFLLNRIPPPPSATRSVSSGVLYLV
jgi:hypothetical protein